MKVLKDPDQVLRIIDAKLDELRKKFDEAGEEKAAEIYGQEVAISSIARRVRHAIEVHDYFRMKDMEWVYEYVDNARENAHEYRNPRATWLMKGIAKRAAWACAKLEDRMEEEP